MKSIFKLVASLLLCASTQTYAANVSSTMQLASTTDYYFELGADPESQTLFTDYLPTNTFFQFSANYDEVNTLSVTLQGTTTNTFSFQDGYYNEDCDVSGNCITVTQSVDATEIAGQLFSFTVWEREFRDENSQVEDKTRTITYNNLYGLLTDETNILYTLDDYETNFKINYVSATTPVPLPAGIYLFLSGLVGLGLMRGRNG